MASLDSWGPDVDLKPLCWLQAQGGELIYQACSGDTPGHAALFPWLEASMPRLKCQIPCCAECMSDEKKVIPLSLALADKGGAAKLWKKR